MCGSVALMCVISERPKDPKSSVNDTHAPA